MEEGVVSEAIEQSRSLDLRYLGQSYTLNLPWTGIEESARRFEQAHEARYGHRVESPVELVNLRVALRGPAIPFRLSKPPAVGGPVHAADGESAGVPRYARDELAADSVIEGPAVVTETVATTWVAPGWRCRVDPQGNLLLELI
jgi:N-methylhydantoinase A